MKQVMRLSSSTIALSALLTLLIIVSSCGSNDEEAQKVDNIIEKMIDSGNVALGISGKVFVIPSPIQTAVLIQKSGARYDKGILNTPDKLSAYSTKFKKCLNLGVYGADLGYCTLYDQTQDALGYFNTTNKLATDLGLVSVFDKTLIDRFVKNVGIKDSVLSLVSDAYRSSNDFLKNNERNEEAALILAGGWIETLHFALNVQKSKTNLDVARRIAEQKSTLNNLISLLSQNSGGGSEYADVLNMLNDLKSDYDKVKFVYQYRQSVTDEATKTTTINCVTDVAMPSEVSESISEKVATLRNYVIT